MIELTGGNDGLNTVVPFKDPEYAKLRPTLKLPENQLKKINDSLGLHPPDDRAGRAAAGQGPVRVQGVGYPNPTQSHFRSMDIWQAAAPKEVLTEGWLGKALKALPGTPGFHLKSANEGSPLAVEGAPVRVPSISTLEEFQLQLAAASGADKKNQREVIEGAVQGSSSTPGLARFRAAHRGQHLRQQPAPAGDRQELSSRNRLIRRPALANRLQLAAQLIDADLGARIFYVSIGNFDTHAAQANAHANLLGQLSGAMTAFFKDLAARGHRDRVLMMTFSEFGRRARRTAAAAPTTARPPRCSWSAARSSPASSATIRA